MRKQGKVLAATAAIALLAACNSGDEGTSGEEASADAGDALLEPGQYEVSIKVLDMDMPQIQGMPANAEEMFRSTMENTSSYCLTPEQASDFAFTRTREQAEEQMGGECTIERDENSRTKLDMIIACNPEGGAMRMEMTGDITDDGVRVLMDAEGEVAGQRMAFQTEHLSRRIGDCEAEPAADAQ